MAGCWWLMAECWLLAADGWLLAGCWLLMAGGYWTRSPALTLTGEPSARLSSGWSDDAAYSARRLKRRVRVELVCVALTQRKQVARVARSGWSALSRLEL